MIDAKLKKIFAKSDHTACFTWIGDAFCRNVAQRTLAGCNHLITIPAGLGKTSTALKIMAAALREGPVWYVAPQDSLTAAKISLIKNSLAGVNASVMCRSERARRNRAAVIWSADTLLLHLPNLSEWPAPVLILVDDAEFLGHPADTSLETLLLLLPPDTPRVLLLNPAANTETLCAWLQTLAERPCHLEVPALAAMPRPAAFVSTMADNWEMTPLLDKKRLTGKVKRLLAETSYFPTLQRLVQGLHALLDAEGLLPAAVLLPSARDCDTAVEALLAFKGRTGTEACPYWGSVLTNPSVSAILESHPFLKDYPPLTHAVSKRAAACHGEQHPLFILLVEYLLSFKALDLIFGDLCSLTRLSARVRSVVLYCPGGASFDTPILAIDSSRMARITRLAGRAGTDQHGCVALMQAPYTDVTGLKDLLLAENGPIKSHWQCDCPTTLSLLTHTSDPQHLIKKALIFRQKTPFGAFCLQSLHELLSSELPEAACVVHIKTITALLGLGVKLEVNLNKLGERLAKRPNRHFKQQLTFEKQRLETILAQLPCNTCAHANFCRKRGSRKLRKLFEAYNHLAAAFDQSTTGIEDDLAFYLRLLQDFNCVDARCNLTPTGMLAFKTGLRLPLPLTACLEHNLPAPDSAEAYVAILAGFVRCEQPLARTIPQELAAYDEALVPVWNELAPILRGVQARLLRYGILPAPPSPVQSALMLAFKRGKDVPTLNRISGFSQGAIVDLLEQTTCLAERLGPEAPFYARVEYNPES